MPEQAVKGKNLTLESEDDIEENPEEVKARVKLLRALVEKEKSLNVRTDDSFMLRYLRCSQFDPDMALNKMKNYYSLKRQHPQWFATAGSFSSSEAGLSRHSHYLLEERDLFGKRIYVNELGLINPSKTTIQKQSQLHDLFLEIMFDEDETQLNGISVIIDLKNYSWSLLRWLTPGNVSVAVKKIESLPTRKMQFHVVNTSVLLNASLKLILPFMSAKTKENIHFHHENWPSLHKVISPDCLPHKYGGKKQDVNVEKLLQIIHTDGDRLKKNLDLGYMKDQ